jgi:chitodextrinase
MSLALNTSHPLYSHLKMLLAVDSDGVVKDLVTPSRAITRDPLCTIGTGTYGSHFETTPNGTYNFHGLAFSPAFDLSSAAPGAAVFVAANDMVGSSGNEVLFDGISSGGIYPKYTSANGKVSHYSVSASASSADSTASIAVGAHSFAIARNGDTNHKTYIDGALDMSGASGPGYSGSFSVLGIGGNAGSGSVNGQFVYIAVFDDYLTDAQVAELHSSLTGSNAFSLVTAAAADTTAPTMTGAITSSNVTGAGFKLDWLAASDDVAVTGYEVSIDNGSTYTNVSNVLTVTESGLAASTLYHAKVRAYDAAGNKATPLSLDVTTAAPSGDTTVPVLAGSITPSAIAQTGFTISWPAGSDNVAVTGYEYSTNGGTSYADAGNVLTKAVTGLTASTAYGVRVRAYDAAGNKSTPALSATVTTASPGVGTLTTPALKNNTGTVLANEVGAKAHVYNVTTGALVVAKTGQSTSAGGVMTVTDAAIVAGTEYRVVIILSSGAEGMEKVTAT